MVLTFPSFLERKFRLKEVRMATKGSAHDQVGMLKTHRSLLPSCPHVSTGGAQQLSAVLMECFTYLANARTTRVG